MFLLLILLLMYFMNPSKAEVERYFEENSCVSQDYCVYYMRRNTAMLLGQIFEVPSWFIPKFILYTTTPFNYYHEVDHAEDEWYIYTWVDTKDGRFVYNAVNGEYVKEINNKKDPARVWFESKSESLNPN